MRLEEKSKPQPEESTFSVTRLIGAGLQKIGITAHDVVTEVKQCIMCYEPTAMIRKCCNALYCDHCYTKNRMCPSCKQATRIEKMTGATFMLPVFSEHEECRRCLDPGLQRRCCGNYYCDECYYSAPNCRSCEKPISAIGNAQLSNGRGTILSVVTGYCLTIMMVLVFGSGVAIIALSENLTPIGISDYSCHGFFRKCDVWLDIGLDPTVATGSPLTPLYNWKYADINSTVKLQSWGCIYDALLYQESHHLLGYDVCMKDFTPGVYVFEDNFEHWQDPLNFKSNLLKSALWLDMKNGNASDNCGVGEFRGYKNALSFSGENERYATTVDFNIMAGGWLEAELFLPPVGYDLSHPFCKTNYGGDVYVECSTDAGKNWHLVKSYESVKWRQDKFFRINLGFPEECMSSTTRFRFSQYYFEVSSDAWAIDNVKIFRNFPKDWHDNAGFIENVGLSKKKIQFAQCCFDTERCEKRLENMEKCKQVPEWVGPIYGIRADEYYVILCFIIGLIKFVYVSVQNWLMYKRFPFNDEYECVVRIDWLMKYLPARYRPSKNFNDLVSDIHSSARLVGDLKDEIADEEGKIDEEAEKMKKLQEKEKKRRKKEKFKRKKKLGYSDEDAMKDSSDEEDETEKIEKELGAEKALANDVDKLKRQNIAALRIPFEVRSDSRWREFFLNASICTFIVLFLSLAGMTPYYMAKQDVEAFGKLSAKFYISSISMNFLAFVCDFKELYYNLKNVVPIRDEFIPYLTLDLTKDGNAIYFGHNIIGLESIAEQLAFPSSFATLCALGYFMGSFPWCMLHLIMREQYLPFRVNRVLGPTLASIFFVRAILGPSFLIKIAFALQFMFDFDLHTRDKVGVAFQQRKTKNASYFGAFMFCIFCTFICTVVALPYVLPVFLASLFGGYFYGTLTGFIHSLPVKPWMVLTTLNDGVYLRCKKKQRCPCIYWFGYCTDMHDIEEIFIIYPEENVKFFASLKMGNLLGDDG